MKDLTHSNLSYRNEVIFIALAIIFSLIFGSCQQTQPGIKITTVPSQNELSLEYLVGTWQEVRGTTPYLRFNEDGTFQDALDEVNLDIFPLDKGDYLLEGNELTMLYDSNSLFCPGATAKFSVRIPQTHGLELTSTYSDPDCENKDLYSVTLYTHISD